MGGYREIEVSIVDAFTDRPLAGNAAGVVPDADGLSEEAMAAIAAELNASETAFLLSSEAADRRIRYFTPTTEIELCGHATVASHAWLLETGAIEPGSHSVETDVGVLDVDIDDGGVVWLSGEVATVDPVDLDYARVADALGADPATLHDVGAELPIAVASAGLAFLVVPVNFLEALGSLDPDFGAIQALVDEVDATGLYAFSFDTLGADSTLHGRAFAPGAGIPEDPVTGTASAAVGAYLREQCAFDGELPEEMRFEQGQFVDRPGHVRVRARSDPVSVGGVATTALEGTMAVPEFDSDEIIEA